MPRINVNGRRLALPRNRPLRLSIGWALLVGGVLGFMPILGFWMVPMGLMILSVDLAFVRRFRRRLEVKVFRRWRAWRARRALRREEAGGD